jgi:hypothetical protein
MRRARAPGTSSHSTDYMTRVILTYKEVHPGKVHGHLVTIILSNQLSRHEPMLKSLFEQLVFPLMPSLRVEKNQILHGFLIFQEGQESFI